MRSSLLKGIVVVGLSSLIFGSTLMAQVLTDEQFNGTAIDTSVFTFDTGNTIFGRSLLNSPGLSGPFDEPTVDNGVLQLRLQSYSPFNSTGELFLADEIRTRREFAPTDAVGFSFETRARFVDDAENPLSPGVIGGLFLFGVDADFPEVNERDEIDFELLSNFPQDTITTNVFNDQGFDQSGTFQVQNIPGLDLTQFNDYRIETRIDSTRFFVNDQLIREEVTNLAVEPQDFRLNINAQGPEFPQAFSDEIQPTADPDLNETFILEVDSLVITQLAASETLLLADFSGGPDDQFTFGTFDSGTLTADGLLIDVPASASTDNFGGVEVFNDFGDGLISEGVFLTEDSQFLVEADIGENNDTDLVLAIRESSGEFFSVTVFADDLADDGQAIVSLSDFFFNGDPTDGIINDSIIGVSLQSPVDSGNAVNFTAGSVSIFTVDPASIPEPASTTLVLMCGIVAAFRRHRSV